MNWKLIILPALAVLVFSNVCDAGLGKPLPARGSGGPGEALRRATAALEREGFDSARIDAALAKLKSEHPSLLAQEGPEAKAGGYYVYVWWDFFFFILVVALVVWLIMVLIEADRGYYYRRRY